MNKTEQSRAKKNKSLWNGWLSRKNGESVWLVFYRNVWYDFIESENLLDNETSFFKPTRQEVRNECKRRNLELRSAKKIDLEKLTKDYNKRFPIKDKTYDNSSINNLKENISGLKPCSIKIKLNDDDALRLKNWVNEINKSLNIENALTLIKYSLKYKISQMIGDISIDSSEMEDARCLFFSLDDVEKFLNKK